MVNIQDTIDFARDVLNITLDPWQAHMLANSGNARTADRTPDSSGSHDGPHVGMLPTMPTTSHDDQPTGARWSPSRPRNALNGRDSHHPT